MHCSLALLFLSSSLLFAARYARPNLARAALPLFALPGRTIKTLIHYKVTKCVRARELFMAQLCIIDCFWWHEKRVAHTYNQIITFLKVFFKLLQISLIRVYWHFLKANYKKTVITCFFSTFVCIFFNIFLKLHIYAFIELLKVYQKFKI